MLDIQAVFAKKTLVFGHRGAKAYAPMNTLPSFELAYQQGAHGIELDVQRSRDGYPVILHDFTIDHTTNGTGLITAMTLAEIKALDAGSWFGAAFSGVTIPTLDEVFESVGQRLLVNVEIKSVDVQTSDGVEQVVATCIARHAMADRVIVSSFNPYALRRFRAIMPDVAIGLLYEKSIAVDAHALMQDLPYEAYHPYFKEITPEMVTAEHAAGRILNTWTVNKTEDALALRALGVNCIITDHPDVILKALSA